MHADPIVDRAKAGDRAAIRQVFEDVYPPVRRAAIALTGDEPDAGRVVADVYARAARVLPRWSEGTDPTNWFYHHALIAARRLSPGRPDSASDPLVTAVPEPARTPAYVAFVRGVRRLPGQQAEAFLLHHGERLNVRLLGVVMDCSVAAADTHLKAADEAMRTLAGDDFATLAETLRKAMVATTPTPEATRAFVAGRSTGGAGGRAVSRGALFVIAAIVAAVAVWWLGRGRYW